MGEAVKYKRAWLGFVSSPLRCAFGLDRSKLTYLIRAFTPIAAAIRVR